MMNGPLYSSMDNNVHPTFSCSWIAAYLVRARIGGQVQDAGPKIGQAIRAVNAPQVNQPDAAGIDHQTKQ